MTCPWKSIDILILIVFCAVDQIFDLDLAHLGIDIGRQEITRFDMH